jgi:dephospho-CoA kinase
MLKSRKVAVTGGLSCGKSSVCRIFHELGAFVISADEIVHQLLSSVNSELVQDIIALLGETILVNNQMDRSKIAEIVFSNPDLLLILENILHPAVYSEIENEYQRHAQQVTTSSLFIAEVPLLFETAGEQFFSATIAVVADEELCIQRFCSYKNRTREEYKKRMNRQLSSVEKAKRATYTITNEGSFLDLYHGAQKLLLDLGTTQVQ